MKCGTIGYDDEDYCSLCGHELSWFNAETDQESSNRCSSCGAALRHPVACFCGACGAKV
ncbi:MAG: zinc ribbon domain-containing protein [Candidatus Kapaibacterium sp.]